jgi:hypothetical protein
MLSVSQDACREPWKWEDQSGPIDAKGAQGYLGFRVFEGSMGAYSPCCHIIPS